MKEPLLFFLFVIVLLYCREIHAGKSIVIAVGGFRGDYLENNDLKGIRTFKNYGVHSSDVYPVYPTLTVPNIQTIVTGLYPESHGMVGDVMYDDVTSEFYNPLSENDHVNPRWWNEADPVWVTAEKQELKAAQYWWPGCQFEVGRVHSRICEKYKPAMPADTFLIDFQERINDIIEMFKSSELDLALVYCDIVREYGLEYGPQSQELDIALKALDDGLLHLIKRLQYDNLADTVNVIIVSTHGLIPLSNSNTKSINLEQFTSVIKHQVMHGAISMISPVPEKTQELHSKLSGIDGLKVYARNGIPDDYHIKNNNRTLPFLLQAEPGHIIQQLEDNIKTHSTEDSTGNRKAIYGYEVNADENMKTVFLAIGPAFKKNYEANSIFNVDIYNVICHTIGLIPLQNNGSWDRIMPMLKDSNINPPTSCSSTLPSILLILSITVITYAVVL